MAPKKIVPGGTDDIIELTDIVEEGKLPQESAADDLNEVSFEDELDSMLADVPELSVAANKPESLDGQGAPSPAAPAPDSDMADLDSLLEDLGDDLEVKPPAPKTPSKAASPADEVFLDVDDLLAEENIAEKAESASADADGDSVDDFLAEFADVDDNAFTGVEVDPASIDGASIGADELLAELEKASGDVPEEDDLLLELKSLLADDPIEELAAPQAKAQAPEADIPIAEVPLPEADLLESAMAAPAPADPVESVMAGGKPVDEIPATQVEEIPAADQAEAMSVDEAALKAETSPPEATAADIEVPLADPGSLAAEPEESAEEDALSAEGLQQLDALLDDILQPGGVAAPASASPPASTSVPVAGDQTPEEVEEAQVEPVEIASPAAAPEEIDEPASSAVVEPSVAAPSVDAAALTAALLAEDGPLLIAVRDMVRHELEERLAALEERLTLNLDKAAAESAARIIREEISALAQDLLS